MNENEWISVDKALPEIGKDVLIITSSSKEYCEATLKQEKFFGTNVFLFRNGGFVYAPTHWRPIPEKRPDFSRLKIGDAILINLPDTKICFLHEIDEENILTCSYLEDYKSYSTFWHPKKRIKKITRINIQEQTFEEI
jgi:predicted mannosyl-3-phosphoglycerate phosphatase (HAD superfamily)